MAKERIYVDAPYVVFFITPSLFFFGFSNNPTHLKAFHQHYHIIKTIRLFLYFYFGVWEASYFLSTPKNKTQKGGIFFFLSLLDFIHLFIYNIFFCSFFSQQVANSSNAPFSCCVAGVLLNKLMAGEEITRI